MNTINKSENQEAGLKDYPWEVSNEEMDRYKAKVTLYLSSLNYLSNRLHVLLCRNLSFAFSLYLLIFLLLKMLVSNRDSFILALCLFCVCVCLVLQSHRQIRLNEILRDYSREAALIVV